MAARRLLIIMVVLLAVSTLAAALVPPPEERTASSTTTTSTTMPAAASKAGGKLVREEVAVPRPGDGRGAIELRAGDQLALVVTSSRPGEVRLPAFGLVEFAGPGNPARFDLLVERPGNYPLRFEDGTVIAAIEVSRRETAGDQP